jgi:predicted dehydrogenase
LSLINDRSDPVRAGLYGAGAFGAFILQALTTSESMRVTALGSRTPSRANELAAKHNIGRVYPMFEQLIADPQLDAVILASPPGKHGAQTLAALAEGKHVLVEKPLATTLDEAEAIIRVAASNNLIVALDYPMLYTPLVAAARLFAKSRLSGPLLRLSVENIASCEGLDDEHWFWNKDISGGIFVEHGVHFFDWLGRIAGEAERVMAFAYAQARREDRVLAVVQHAGGAFASYYHAFVTQPRTERTRCVLAFESVELILDGWIPAQLQLRGQGAAVATTTIRRMVNRSVTSIAKPEGFIFDAGPSQPLYLDGVRAAAEDFARSIREPGYVAHNDARKAFASLRVAIAANDAAASGVAVNLPRSEISALP